jgi:eukaryotic-like serine/threonine-protein kinase
MTPEQWEKISRLYHAAVELEPDERAAFLNQACSGDDAIRREVESLITAGEQAGGFIAESALKDAALMATMDAPPPLPVDHRIGHYVVKGLLGRGGMGEVYLAQDTRLGRQVALKTLPPGAQYDRKSPRRFLREARSAAALNHPGIVTVYSVEEVGDSFFIVMEYLEGETLRDRLARRALEFSEVVDLGLQISAALTAAHSAGLIHRDIKPSNVMITGGGQVKLLDFGIAKMTAPVGTEGTSGDIGDSFMTVDGAIIGTVAYMSPEQSSGEVLDARTDIFSLGTVLYEAATGELPFKGSSSISTIQEIVYTEPKAPSSIRPHLPPGFDTVIQRALAKKPEQRFQTASEIFDALRAIRSEAAIPEPSSELSSGARLWRRRNTDSSAGGVHSTPSAGFKITQIEPGIGRHLVITMRRNGAIALGATVLLVLAITAFLAYRLSDRGRPAVDRVAAPPIETKLTNTGNIASARAAISPDGKYVVYAVRDSQEKNSLWVRQLASLSSTQIISPAAVSYGGMSFTRDGNYIYYTMSAFSTRRFSLYRTPLLGGASQKIKDDVDSPISFSPDGERFVFMRSLWAEGESVLLIANADGGEEQRIATMRFPEFFSEPSWSPDGKAIACAGGTSDGGPNRYVVEVSVGDWVMKTISNQKWLWVGPVEWLMDGKGLLIIANDSPVHPYRVWRLSYPEGQAKVITNNMLTYSRMSLTADSSTLLALAVKKSTSMWLVAADEPLHAEKLTFGTGGYSGRLRWMDNGKMIYESNAAGANDISIMNEDGSDQRPLLGELAAQGTPIAPAATPDGRYIVFAFDITGLRHIWRMDIDGRNLIQLTNGQGEDQPYCSADGKWVLYTDIGSQKPTLWMAPIDGGKPVQLTTAPSKVPTVSPDGKFIACFYLDEAQSEWKIAVLRMEGGKPVRVFPQRANSGIPIKWTRDGRNLTYTELEQGNIWLQPVEGGPPRKLTSLSNDLIFGFEWSPDGTRLACVRGIWERDMVLVNNLN